MAIKEVVTMVCRSCGKAISVEKEFDSYEAFLSDTSSTQCKPCSDYEDSIPQEVWDEHWKNQQEMNDNFWEMMKHLYK